MLTTKNTTKLKWIATVILLILSMLLSGCSAAPNTPDADGEKPEETEPPVTDEGEKPFDPSELSENIEYGYYISGSYRLENVAWKSPRVITDINDITITLSFGFLLDPGVEPTDLNDPEIYQNYLENHEHFKNADIYFLNPDMKLHYRTTDEYFTSPKYVCDEERVSLGKCKLIYNHEEEVTLPAELFADKTGLISVWFVADSNNSTYHERYERGKPFIVFGIHYKKMSDGKIILITDAERSSQRVLDWLYGEE